jgi:EAL domain-containing protein (putative c-di-GMP-specific phosphodiesterase class I)
VRLSIDDFGTGYSSLAYLKRLPVDEMKIDKSFVMGMERDPDDAKIVRSTIDLAHNMGLSVVAEGVENAAILALLREQGCDEAQGYHMSKPLPVDAFKLWRTQWLERTQT